MGNQQAQGNALGGYGAERRPPSSAQEEAERQQRANALQNRIDKKQPKKKTAQEVKADHWKAYNAIDGSTAAAAGHAGGGAKPSSLSSSASPSSTPSAGYRLADGARVSSNSSSPSPTHADSSSSYQPPTLKSVPSSSQPQPSPKTSSSTLKTSTSNSLLQSQPAHPLEARAARGVYKKKDDSASRWKTYEQLDALSQQQASANAAPSPNADAALQITDPDTDRSFVSLKEANELKQTGGLLPAKAYTPSSSPMTSSPASQEPSIGMDPHFRMQMESLLQQAQKMPVATLDLIRKMLANLNKPSLDDIDKYRRVKLSNDKIQQSIVHVSGAIELLLAVGFEVDQLILPNPTSTAMTQEDYLIWRDSRTNQEVVAIALAQLDQLLANRKS